MQMPQNKSDLQHLHQNINPHKNICEICKATSANCNCEAGPTIEPMAQPVENTITYGTGATGTDGTSATSADGTSAPGPENPENAVPPPGQRGGRKSRKNKRRGSKKSAKKMSCLW